MFRQFRYICFLALSFAWTTSSLQAELEDHFKKATDKVMQPQMRNIDFIYMINLDQRPEKYAQCVQKLAPFGIVPYRFSAVNGWELPIEAINEVGLKYETWMNSEIWGTSYLPSGNLEPFHEIIQEPGRTYFCHCMSRGAIGIVLSHLSILQDAYDSGFETIWVMEDDIEIIHSPHYMSDFIDDLDSLLGKDGWDILFTDQDTISSEGNRIPCSAYAKRPNFVPPNPDRYEEKYNINPDLRYIGSRYGAYSMIVRRSGMKKILDFIKAHSIFLPYDMEYTLPPKIRLFTVTTDIVSTQIQAPSDNGGPNYLNRGIKDFLVEGETDD